MRIVQEIQEVLNMHIVQSNFKDMGSEKHAYYLKAMGSMNMWRISKTCKTV